MKQNIIRYEDDNKHIFISSALKTSRCFRSYEALWHGDTKTQALWKIKPYFFNQHVPFAAAKSG